MGTSPPRSGHFPTSQWALPHLAKETANRNSAPCKMKLQNGQQTWQSGNFPTSQWELPHLAVGTSPPRSGNIRTTCVSWCMSANCTSPPGSGKLPHCQVGSFQLPGGKLPHLAMETSPPRKLKNCKWKEQIGTANFAKWELPHLAVGTSPPRSGNFPTSQWEHPHLASGNIP